MCQTGVELSFYLGRLLFAFRINEANSQDRDIFSQINFWEKRAI